LHFRFSFEPRFSEVDKSLFLAPTLRATSCNVHYSGSILYDNERETWTCGKSRSIANPRASSGVAIGFTFLSLVIVPDKRHGVHWLKFYHVSKNLIWPQTFHFFWNFVFLTGHLLQYTKFSKDSIYRTVFVEQISRNISKTELILIFH
jgi:hypothetical protein